MSKESVIGKILYNASFLQIGIVTDVVISESKACFEIGSVPEGVSPGRYWEVSRLNNEKKDAIYLKDPSSN